MLPNDIILEQALCGILLCLALASLAMLFALRRPPVVLKPEPRQEDPAETARLAARAALRSKLVAFKSALAIPLQEAADMRLALRRATGTASRLPLTLAPLPNFDVFPGAAGDVPPAAAEAVASLPRLLEQREAAAADLRAPKNSGAPLPLAPLQVYLQTMAEIGLQLDAALESLEISAAGPSSYQQNLASQS